jgi:glycosyltransferase involved in cell wall biosynthesis
MSERFELVVASDVEVLDAVVVIPARDERRMISECLKALALQTIDMNRFEVVVVADACTDDTAAMALAWAKRLGLKLRTLDGPGTGSGPARRLGMDVAAERLLSSGRPDGLIATTDADSRPAPDWLERQLEHLASGAGAVAGLIELDPAEAASLPDAVLRRRAVDAAARLEELRRRAPSAEHHHFAGSSLGVSAAVYRRVGGLEPVPSLEDEAFQRRLTDRGISIRHAADVRVRTSARVDSRAHRGLGVDLAVSLWAERRRYRAEDFSLETLARQKGETTVTVLIPTRDCASTVVGVITETVGPLLRAGLVDDLVVIDAASVDGTADLALAAGARVIQEDAVLTEYGPALGKGDAMWRGLYASGGEIVCFLDGDTRDPDPLHLQGLLGPLLADPSIQFVKGSFERPLRVGDAALPFEGGRVTELMARPLLNLHEPLLAGFAQPLAGEFAARRELFESLPFPAGYGVEIAVLIDSLRAFGLDALAECQLGTRQNRHQTLRALGEMAYAVLAAVEQRREGPHGRPSGHYLKPWEDGAVTRIPVLERPPLRAVRQDQQRAGDVHQSAA